MTNTTSVLVGQTIATRSDELAQLILERIYRASDYDWDALGAPGKEKGLKDIKYHFDYLIEALNVNDPTLFVEYIAWVAELFAGLNLPADALISTLEATERVFEETLSVDEQIAVRPYLKAAMSTAQAEMVATPSTMESRAPLSDLAEAYLEALLWGERHVASRLITDAAEGGASIKDIYLDVFQRSQHEVGRLWQTNQIGVAQEHYCTAATQLIMSQLYPYIFATDKIGKRLVSTCIGGELHELGIRMVTDFFEMEGWDTYYLGSNTPAESILQTLKERQADALGISATMTFHVSAVSELIKQVRAHENGKNVKILVGGYPFNIAPDLWKQIGADGFGYNAQAAIDQANELVG